MFALQGDMLCSGPDTHWSLCFESLTVLVKITADDHCAEARAVLSTELTGGGRGRALGVRSDWWLVSTLTAPHSVEPLTELQHSSDNHQASTPGRAESGDTGDREREGPARPAGRRRVLSVWASNAALLVSAESGARPQSRPRGVDNGVAGAVRLSPGLTPESLRGRQLLSLSLARTRRMRCSQS